MVDLKHYKYMTFISYQTNENAGKLISPIPHINQTSQKNQNPNSHTEALQKTNNNKPTPPSTKPMKLTNFIDAPLGGAGGGVEASTSGAGDGGTSIGGGGGGRDSGDGGGG